MTKPQNPTVSHGRCQCAACGEYFVGSRDFDRHRYGPFTHDPRARRCRTGAEMLSDGWTRVGAGYWRAPPPKPKQADQAA